MQFPESWLRTFVNPQLGSDALGHLLTMAGLEVEEKSPAGALFQGVVVAQVEKVEAHPNADKLRVCHVNAGDPTLVQIVCGAPNVREGIKVPLAMVGAVLPGGLKIKAAKLRGIASAGMLCSAKELGISDEQTGLLELSAEAEIGQNLRQTLDLDDQLFTIKLTPNRADCFSVLGVAREVAALSGASLTLPQLEACAVLHQEQCPAKLVANEACPRYYSRIIRGVDASVASPAWLKTRLERSGLRSVSVLVDVTNYVMLELGQPLHAYDYDNVNGNIQVRFAQPGEKTVLLNGQELIPTADTLVIADDDKILGLAGVMGGESTAVSKDTQNVCLEAAFFQPEVIAGRTRQYTLTSDAAHRFERGVDFDLPQLAIERASALILEICGGQCGPLTLSENPEALPQRHAVTLRPQRVRALLGMDIASERMLALLESVQLSVDQHDGDHWVVTPPSFRFDIAIEEDLVEEIIRLHGYDHVPTRAPGGRLQMQPLPERCQSVWAIRERMAERDYQEVINYAFIDENWVKDFFPEVTPIALANPIASQMNVMRPSLIPGLVASYALNRRRQQERVRLFELGRCFVASDDSTSDVSGYLQPQRLGALLAGTAQDEQWGVSERGVDFFDLKGDVESLFAHHPEGISFERLHHPALHPGRAAIIRIADTDVGMLGEIHPQWVEKYDLVKAPMVFEIDMTYLKTLRFSLYNEISRVPVVMRDIALVVDNEISAAQVTAVLQRAAGALVQEIRLFDVYQGKGVEDGKKSLAFRVLLQDTARTLEDAEVDATMAKIVDHAVGTLNARLRT